jgi:hypothetical protein
MLDRSREAAIVEKRKICGRDHGIARKHFGVGSPVDRDARIAGQLCARHWTYQARIITGRASEHESEPIPHSHLLAIPHRKLVV